MPRIIPEARYQGGEYLGEHTVGGRLQLGIARAPHELRPERYRVQLLGGEHQRRQVEPGPQHVAESGRALDRHPASRSYGNTAPLISICDPT